MKMNMEIELDFINEDFTVSDEVEQAIINRASLRIEKAVLEQIKPKIDNAFNDGVQKVIDNILEDYMSKPMIISDGYNTKKFDSVFSMVQERFTSLYDEKFRGKNGCQKDPIVEKVKSQITYDVNKMIETMQNTIKREGAKIAKDEIEQSNMFKALEKLNA